MLELYQKIYLENYQQLGDILNSVTYTLYTTYVLSICLLVDI